MLKRELSDNIKDTYELPHDKRLRESGGYPLVDTDTIKTPYNNEELMTELLSIYAINLIPLITSLYLVPNYKTTIIKLIISLFTYATTLLTCSKTNFAKLRALFAL